MTIIPFAHRQRNAHREPVGGQGQPRAQFRILQGEAELEEALRRAADSERAIAAHLQSRIERYEARFPSIPLGHDPGAAGGAHGTGQLVVEGGAR